MKLHYLTIIFLAAIFALQGCGSESGGGDDPIDELSQQELVTQQLSESPWSSMSVSADGNDSSSDFIDFVLTFGDGTYQSSNGGDIWEKSGTWEFVENSSDQILRDDGVLVDLQLGESTLTLELEVEEEVLIGGRIKTVRTTYVFSLQN